MRATKTWLAGCALAYWAVAGTSLTMAAERAADHRLLAAKIRGVVDASPGVARGRMGFKFVDVGSGAVLAEENSAHFFTPASNAKLYTTALALARLGPEYRFRTELRTSGSYSAGRDTIAELRLVGGGDPNLSGRTLPYLTDAPEGDPLAALKQLADIVVERGIRSIQGDVIGVATRYQGGRYPDGWTLDDSLYSYGAPVSSLPVNDSSVALTLRPSELGELASVEVRPAVRHFIVQNQVVTDNGAGAHIQLARSPGSNEVLVSGTIGSRCDEWRQDIAVDDPALFAAEAFMAVLQERGIQVNGQARAQYENDYPQSATSVLIGERISQPLSEVLRVVNKESQNLHSEMLLREVAFVRTGIGSLENGRQELRSFLAEAGITESGTGYVLEDGSGLARQDLTTPDATVALLRYMWMRPDRETWVNTLPIGGLDGSLEHRFHKIAGSARIRAKTGSLAHVNTLSGYLETREHQQLAFSVMVNGTAGHESEVRDFIDRLCAVFLSI